MLHDPIPPGRARSYAGCLDDFAASLTAYVTAAHRAAPRVERLPDNTDMPSDAEADRAYYRQLVL